MRRLTKLQLLRYLECDAFFYFMSILFVFIFEYQTGIIDDDVELFRTVIFVKNFLQSYSSKPHLHLLKVKHETFEFSMFLRFDENDTVMHAIFGRRIECKTLKSSVKISFQLFIV